MGYKSASAQGAKFDVNSNIGCNPFTVVVTDLSGAHDTTAVNYDWGDGSQLDSTEFHTYNQAGIYTIIQTVANADPRQDTMEIEVIDHYPPEYFLFNCAGTIGSVLVQDTLYKAYQVDWGDGNSENILANSFVSHDYGVLNSFDVTVKGLINGAQTANDSSNFNCSSTTKRINTIIDIQPATIDQIQVINTDAAQGSIYVNYSLAPNNNYLIEIKDQNQAGYTVIDTIRQIINPTGYLIENLNTNANYYCISITAFDPCDGDRLQSNIGCSINIQATSENQQNRINWETSSIDFFSYSVLKDGSLVSNINNQAQNQYVDIQVSCGITYQYQVTMSENNGFISISDTSSATAVSTIIPDAISNISASVENQDIHLSWVQPPNFTAVGYIISRSVDGTTYDVLDTLTTTEYLDQGLVTQSTQYFYKISYYDACGNFSDESIVANQMLLVSDFNKVLNWSNYEGWENGVREYIVEKYNETGQLVESISVGSTTSYQEDPAANPYQYLLYKIVAIPIDISIEQARSNLLEIIYRSKVAFPNAFSPDGDGTNDIFNFKSRYIFAVTMKIYNRWGELVYQTTEVDKGWDGTINGRPAPLGTYIHHTELTDDMGITFVKSGEIVLIR